MKYRGEETLCLSCREIWPQGKVTTPQWGNNKTPVATPAVRSHWGEAGQASAGGRRFLGGRQGGVKMGAEALEWGGKFVSCCWTVASETEGAQLRDRATPEARRQQKGLEGAFLFCAEPWFSLAECERESTSRLPDEPGSVGPGPWLWLRVLLLHGLRFLVWYVVSNSSYHLKLSWELNLTGVVFESRFSQCLYLECPTNSDSGCHESLFQEA